jgi:hypothetical protein
MRKRISRSKPIDFSTQREVSKATHISGERVFQHARWRRDCENTHRGLGKARSDSMLRKVLCQHRIGVLTEDWNAVCVCGRKEHGFVRKVLKLVKTGFNRVCSVKKPISNNAAVKSGLTNVMTA